VMLTPKSCVSELSLYGVKEFIGDIVKRFRKENQLTVNAFIELLSVDISPAYITQIEVYGKIPSIELLFRIAEVIGKEPEELLLIAKNIKLQDYHDSLDKKHSEALWQYRRQRAQTT